MTDIASILANYQGTEAINRQASMAQALLSAGQQARSPLVAALAGAVGGYQMAGLGDQQTSTDKAMLQSQLEHQQFGEGIQSQTLDLQKQQASMSNLENALKIAQNISTQNLIRKQQGLPPIDPSNLFKGNADLANAINMFNSNGNPNAIPAPNAAGISDSNSVPAGATSDDLFSGGEPGALASVPMAPNNSTGSALPAGTPMGSANSMLSMLDPVKGYEQQAQLQNAGPKAQLEETGKNNADVEKDLFASAKGAEAYLNKYSDISGLIGTLKEGGGISPFAGSWANEVYQKYAPTISTLPGSLPGAQSSEQQPARGDENQANREKLEGLVSAVVPDVLKITYGDMSSGDKMQRIGGIKDVTDQVEKFLPSVADKDPEVAQQLHDNMARTALTKIGTANAWQIAKSKGIDINTFQNLINQGKIDINKFIPAQFQDVAKKTMLTPPDQGTSGVVPLQTQSGIKYQVISQ